MKWILALVAVFGAFLAAGLFGSAVTHLLGYWGLPGAGFCAAGAVVLVTYLVVPRHKWPSAVASLFLGAAVAWYFLEPSWYPESYGDRGGAYEPTHLPLLATYTGGILGLLVAAFLMQRARAKA
jgi:hypothetical protein